MWVINFWIRPVKDKDGQIIKNGEWKRLASIESEEEAEKIVRRIGKEENVVVVAKSPDGEISHYPSSRSFGKLKWLK
jgi:hypothetical protein